MSTPRLPDAIRAALEDTGQPWRTERGARHLKIIVAERFCGILPLDGGRRSDVGRNQLNVIAQIRRAGKGQFPR